MFSMQSSSNSNFFVISYYLLASQNDIKSIDILVCGKCHEVFSFIEEFQEHKSQTCSQKSQVIPICEFESKSQVWGFTLWKNKHLKLLQEEVSNDWDIYKKWCLLSKTDKDAWISAGQTLQYCNKLGNAKLTEIKVQKMLRDEDKDPLALDGFGKSNENQFIVLIVNNPSYFQQIVTRRIQHLIRQSLLYLR